MKKYFTHFLLGLLLVSASRLYAQQADPAINILFQPASISLANSGTVIVTINNSGASTISAGCLSVTIAVPSIGKITGLSPAVTPGFSSTILNGGAAIQIVNSGSALAGTTAASVSVVVQGVAVGGPASITGTIGYVSGPGSCSAAGNLQTANDISFTTMTVVANPLPVSLVSFTAKAQSNHTVDLAWTTSLETNNKGFLIERSKDLRQFERVGEVTELGSASNALKHYQLTDQSPYWGTSYYRLTQTDLNGKATAYPAVSVVIRDGAYGVFPNPVVNDQRFSLSLDEPETARINFYSSDGRVLPIQKTGVESGNLVLKTSGKLSAGVYLLQVEERGQTRQHRLVVE